MGQYCINNNLSQKFSIPEIIKKIEVQKRFPGSINLTDPEIFENIISPDHITWFNTQNQPGFEIASFPLVF